MSNLKASRETGEGAVRRLYIDQSHVRRHLTGIERVALELFNRETLAPHEVRLVRSRGLAGMMFTQHLLLPILGLMDRSALCIFPGFPPSPLSIALGRRCLIYVHDTFLLTRPQDLNWKARLYMKPSFAWAMRRGQMFLVNSATTARALRAICSSAAHIALLRPPVRDVFGLGDISVEPWNPGTALRLLAIGTIEPRKNYSASLDIVKAINSLGVPAELHIVGRTGWGEHSFLRNPPPFLTLHGYLDDAELKRLVKNCHLLLSTSSAEGLGLPLLEIQHGGLPVVAPKGEVFEEALGGSGLLIDPSDPLGAARAILALARDTGRLAAQADASRANVLRWNELASEDLNRFRGFVADSSGVLGTVDATARYQTE